MNQCSFIKSDKTSCKARVIQDDIYCFFHSEKQAEKRKEAVLKGGKSIKRNYVDYGELEIKNSEDVITLLEQTINDLRQNKISNKTASTIGFLAGNAMRAFSQDIREKDNKRVNERLGLK